ncbi:MAG: sigma-70 family RNA polymerase sigma factor [Clostridiaceae bacterium]
MNLNKVENLAHLSKKGDIKAKEELAEEFKPLILNLAKKSYIQGFDFEDIKNACYESLFRCLKIYDTSRHRFVAYATTSIKNSVGSLVRTSNRKSRTDGKGALILNDILENTLSCDMGFVEDRIAKDMAAAKIRKAVKSLSYEEQELVDYIFYKKHTLKQYSDYTSLSYSRAVKMKKSVLKKLKEMLKEEDFSM